MKKLIALLLVLTVALGLAACRKEDKKNPETDPDTTPVVTTTPEITTAPTETKDPNLVTYTVKIVDESGNPILDGVAQICSESCVPDMTNEGGVFSWEVAKDDYKISFIKVPAGFVAEDAYYFEAGATEMTIVLKAAA